MHDRIAEQVAPALRAKLGRWRDPGARTTRRPGFEAWETYLRGRYFWARLDTDGVSKALGCFGEAASREPAWAEPRAGLAAVHVLLGLGGVVPPRRAWRVADECAREALERDATLPEAHLASAWVALYRDWAWTEARVALDRAAGLGLPDLHQWRALVLALQGELGPAADALARARETDPFSAVALALQAFLHDVAGEYDQGLLVARRAVELRAEHFLGHWRLGRGPGPARPSRRGDRVAEPGGRQGVGRHGHALRAGLGAGRGRAARRGDRAPRRGWNPRRRRPTCRPTSGRRSSSRSGTARRRWTASTRPRRTGTPGSPSWARTTPSRRSVESRASRRSSSA